MIRKQDASIAKNYRSEPELAALNNLVEQYLIFAQGQAMRRVPMHMADWIEKLNGFLTLNDRDILTDAGAFLTRRPSLKPSLNTKSSRRSPLRPPRSGFRLRAGHEGFEKAAKAAETQATKTISLTEFIVEVAALEWFGEPGYTVGHGPQLAPDEPVVERFPYGRSTLS